jgi:hypothetical protein
MDNPVEVDRDDHRWSGWPGAWCLDCGAEDARELCIADHMDGLFCADCGEVGCLVDGHHLVECAEHRNEPCPELGSNRHNPYTRSTSGG